MRKKYKKIKLFQSSFSKTWRKFDFGHLKDLYVFFLLTWCSATWYSHKFVQIVKYHSFLFQTSICVCNFSWKKKNIQERKRKIELDLISWWSSLFPMLLVDFTQNDIYLTTPYAYPMIVFMVICICFYYSKFQNWMRKTKNWGRK